MAITKSPVSTCGAKTGLCLPRRSVAAWVARRPSTTSAASITCHRRSISPGFGLYVPTGLPCLVGGLGARRGRPTIRAASVAAQQRSTIPAPRAQGQSAPQPHPPTPPPPPRPRPFPPRLPPPRPPPSRRPPPPPPRSPPTPPPP